MLWIAPSEKDTDNAELEQHLWGAADQFRANSGLKSQGYSAPVLGLFFPRFSSARFVSEHKKNSAAELSIHSIEKTDETGRLDFVPAK